MRKPLSLQKGDWVGLAAPAGACAVERIQAGTEVLENWGLRVRGVPENSGKRYMAGEDADRAGQLGALFVDPEIRAVLPVRGGYGSARLREAFDIDLVRANPKLFVGYSDLTVFLTRFVQEAGLVCFHGPMVATDLSRFSDAQRERYRRFLFGEEGWFDGAGLDCWRGGRSEGVLAGGCLSVVVTGLGTPQEIDTRGRLLFLEDVAEKPYRVDRMLTHLRQAGKFDDLAGVVFGAMHDCDDGRGDGIIREIAMEAFDGYDFPVVFGLDAGHLSGNVVVPMGCRAALDADAGTLELLEAPLTSR